SAYPRSPTWRSGRGTAGSLSTSPTRTPVPSCRCTSTNTSGDGRASSPNAPQCAAAAWSTGPRAIRRSGCASATTPPISIDFRLERLQLVKAHGVVVEDVALVGRRQERRRLDGVHGHADEVDPEHVVGPEHDPF